MLIENPWFYVVAVIAVLITGISKSGLGGAVGGTAVPIMALAISPIQAAAIMLPILCVMDIAGLLAYRRTWDRRTVAIMLPAALIGITVGAFTFRYLTDDIVRVIVGTIAVSFATYSVIGARLLGRRDTRPRPPNAPAGALAGLVSGFTSFVAHAGGPPLQIYLLPRRLDKTLFVGTTVVYFAAVNYAKLVPYAIIGQFSAENLMTAAVLLPLAPLGIWLGLRIHKLVSQAMFYRIAYTALFVTGTKLLWDGLGGVL